MSAVNITLSVVCFTGDGYIGYIACDCGSDLGGRSGEVLDNDSVCRVVHEGSWVEESE